MNKLIRITTVPISLKILLKGQLKYMANHGFTVKGISSKGPELDDVRESEGVEVNSLEMTRTISPIKDLKSLWEFYKLCKRENPQIVHSHTPKAGIIGMLGAKLAGVPIRMHTVAGMPLMEARGMRRSLLDFVEKLTYWGATKIYPNSNGLKNFILENGYTTPSKLEVIGNGSSNGIDTSFFSIDQLEYSSCVNLKKDLGILEDDFVFVFVGRIVGDKGINELVSAFSALNVSNMKLLLVGALETSLDPLNRQTLVEIENNKNILSVGFQKDVRPYFAVSDALVFPSYREGFPNVVMQAGAMGLPSIVSNINGCNEIIKNGKNGTIIPVKDSEALKDAMLLFVKDSTYYNKLKNNSRQMVTERYEQGVVWDALLSEYEKLLKDKGLISNV
ncbi:glycosyltransferase family 4 protein [Sphingobacterium sp. Lzh-3]|uniref:glycosyltransferase family 4 protein n=1 Tax=Sphingobacterium sp. Lzh-3 TaxID=3382150 RepID=UPI00398D0B1A